MRKKLFTAAVAFVLSALTSNAFAFPTWLELRNEIINYYKTIDTSKQWCIDSDGDLEITYTSSSGSERKAYIMMIESEQAIPDMPPAVCYFESTTPAKANAKKMIKCADAINWALPPGWQRPFSASEGGMCMEIDLIFKIAAIGIIVAVLNQLLIRSGREDQAMMTTLAGLVVVLSILVKQISVLFVTIKSLFAL